MNSENDKHLPATTYTPEFVTLPSTKSLIASLHCPLSREAREHLHLALDNECSAVAQAYREREMLEAERLDGESHSVSAQLDRYTAELADQESASRGRPVPSWTRTVLAFIFAAACFGAEFVLTWQALTFVLNVPKYSVLGILLGLAPPSAVAVLEVVMLRLIEEPWRRFRTEVAGAPWQRIVASIAMAVFLVGLAWGNVETVLLLAKAREEASKAQFDLAREDNDATVQIDRAAIDRAILAVSICVTVDGAIFLLLALEEVSRLREHYDIRRKIRTGRMRREQAVADRVKTEAALAVKVARMHDLDRDAQAFAERYRRQCLLAIHQLDEQARHNLSAEQLVNFKLQCICAA